MTEPLELALRPEELAARLAEEPGFVHLDSADGDGWSIVTFGPREVCRASTLSDRLVPEQPCGDSRVADGTREASEPPFHSGWIGFLAYEAAPAFERHLKTHPPDAALPLAWWGRYDAALAFDHRCARWWITRSGNAQGRDAAARLRARLALCEESGPRERASHERRALPSDERSDLSREAHHRGVGTILEWIARGHIYQANLTYRVSRPLHGSAHDLYRALRKHNPAPYGGYLRVSDDLAILSSSPELFLRVRGRDVMTRPIKGTRPRDRSDEARDREAAHELLRSEKDRAELTMIVDLERNDLGRVADSVSVDPFPELESYASVHHLVATVRAHLSDGRTWRDLLGATFPGGSVTGAPKIRAMEILS